MKMDGVEVAIPHAHEIYPNEIGIVSHEGKFGIMMKVGDKSAVLVLSAAILRDFSGDLADFVATKIDTLEKQ